MQLLLYLLPSAKSPRTSRVVPVWVGLPHVVHGFQAQFNTHKGGGLISALISSLFPLFFEAVRSRSINITVSFLVHTTRDWGHGVGVAFKKEPELTLAGKALAIAGPKPFQSAVTPSAAINFRAQSRKPEYVP